MHIENPIEQLLVLVYTTNSGSQRTAHLSRSQIYEFIEKFQNNENFVVTSFNETYGINPTLISDFKVLDLYQSNVKIYKKSLGNVESDKVSNVVSNEKLNELKSTLENKDLENAYKDILDFYKIDCVCGTTYVVQIAANTTRGRCNRCKETVYPDRSKGRVDTYKGKAWIMTNKYHITKEMIEQYS